MKRRDQFLVVRLAGTPLTARGLATGFNPQKPAYYERQFLTDRTPQNRPKTTRSWCGKICSAASRGGQKSPCQKSQLGSSSRVGGPGQTINAQTATDELFPKDKQF
jgi:hypothetical protein